MPWWPSFWSSPSSTSSSEVSQTSSEIVNAVKQSASDLKTRATETATNLSNDTLQSPPPHSSQSDLLAALTHPSTLLATSILTTAIFSLTLTYRRFARRIPTAPQIPAAYILSSTQKFTRSLFGQVTTVGDADNFRLYHTPLGRLALWSVLRRVPTSSKALKDQTVHIRLAGVDAPELSHFGRPAQPFSKEALDWLTAYVRGRRVRCYVHKLDQYGRAVATVYIRKGLLRRDVGLQMLKEGLATVYEAKTGAEFAGKEVEKQYKLAEETAKRKKIGMWAAEKGGLGRLFGGGKVETPREYKNKYRDGGGG